MGWVYLIASTLAKATPLVLASSGGLLSELSGVINFALEGMMLAGAFGAVWGAYVTGSAWAGLLFGAAAGMCIAALHAFASLVWRANQIVSSIALNLLAWGLTGMGLHQYFGAYGTSPAVAALPGIGAVLGSAGFPGLGSRLAAMGRDLSILVPVGLASAVWMAILLGWSVWGLHVRACGENPYAARSAGIGVFRTRFLAVVSGGALAGLGGAYLSIGELSQFVENMTRGRGYLAIAAVILGRWNPVGVLLAALLFGFGEALSEWLAVRWPQFPNQIFLVLPYLLCLIVLVAHLGRRKPPSALGRILEGE